MEEKKASNCITSPELYDKLLSSNKYKVSITPKDKIFVLYKKVMKLINKQDLILELGCGTGQLAEILIRNGYNYILGIDFSHTGIVTCKQRCENNDDKFREIAIELYDHKENYNTVIAMEVLEHIENDIEAIRSIKAGSKVVCSVPNYDSLTHLRWFEDKNAVKQRYSHFLDEYKCKQVSFTKRHKFYVFWGKRNEKM